MNSKPKLIETELGTEKLCIRCGEYYPLDDEFFHHRIRKDRGCKKQYEAFCKACYPIHYNKQTNGRYKVKSKHEDVCSG